MSESPPKYAARGEDSYEAPGVLDPSRRPWQPQSIGAQIPPRVQWDLGRILELFPELGSLVVHTTSGSAEVTRNYQDDYTREVDQLLAGIFRDNLEVTGVTFQWAERKRPASEHTATPAEPYWSPLGAESARINAAQARGELTPAEAIAALNKLYRPAAE